jgi:transglutaminase-like putative cysteine protease/predicted glutamine amidotransferase
MSTLLAMSFDSEASPSLSLRRKSGRRKIAEAYGWGFGWFPGDEVTAVVMKNADSTENDAVSGALRDWEQFHSSTFVCHLRGTEKQAVQRDAQPFLKSYAGRHWVFAHNGDLRAGFDQALPLGVHPVFEPIGRSDSEHVFCWLLTSLRAEGARTLEAYGWNNLDRLLQQINDLGIANMILTDGRHVVVHNDRNGVNSLHWIRRIPPHVEEGLRFEDLDVDLTGTGESNRTMVVVATKPESDEPWELMLPDQTLVLRRGTLTWTSVAPNARQTGNGELRAMPPEAVGVLQQTDEQRAAAGIPAYTSDRVCAAAPEIAAEERLDHRILAVTHSTTYRYTQAIEHSAHVLRLRPVHDDSQTVIEYEISQSVEGPTKEFEDVFGNRSVYTELSGAYNELIIQSRSVVRVDEPTAPTSRSPARRDLLPLVWMPWQRQMMLPYLLPPELPESELQELIQFAMSFVARNDNDLYATVADMNETIYRDFSYESGSTNLETTPYDVFISRRGVCQDFANLMICLARLLNVPARYRVGYIFTGGDYENKVQSEASHAWVELYLPWNGWLGFDPTNGCPAGIDHVRIACGRNYRDATPTIGTIYKGGGGTETLEVEVRVEAVHGVPAID